MHKRVGAWLVSAESVLGSRRGGLASLLVGAGCGGRELVNKGMQGPLLPPPPLRLPPSRTHPTFPSCPSLLVGRPLRRLLQRLPAVVVRL